MKRKIELYGTLGPADHSKEILHEMFQAGMTGLRLNLSHTNLADCEDWLHNLYEVAFFFCPAIPCGSVLYPLILKQLLQFPAENIRTPRILLRRTEPNGRKRLPPSPQTEFLPSKHFLL